MVLILGMTLLSLGASQFLRRHASDAAGMKYAGYPGTQALYAAEMGVNDLMYRNNSKATRNAPLEIPPASALPNRVIPYPEGAVTQNVVYRVVSVPPDPAPNVYRFEVTGEARPVGGSTNWPKATRKILVDVATGSHWVIQRYEQK